MNKQFVKAVTLTATICMLGVIQPSVLHADVTHGIVGTGHTAPQSGVGGTGRSTSESGIGGTGIIANKTGIGGTGHTQGEGGIGGTGIVGIVTAFGSIWVNGVEVQYDDKTQVANNNAAAKAGELAIGQVVVVEAQGNDSQLQAKKISMIYATTGEVTAVEENTGKLTVLGQSVMINSQTAKQDGQLFKVGDQIKVSGLRMSSGEIIASHIVRTNAIAEPNLVGPITAIHGKQIEIYDLKIEVATTEGLSLGQEVAVAGTMNGTILSAREVVPSPAKQLYGRTEKINLQGYVGAATKEGQIKIGDLEIEVMNPEKNKLNPGDLVQVSGRFSNEHRVIADRIEFTRDRPEAMNRDNMSQRENSRTETHDRADKLERADHSDNDHADRVDRPDKPDRSDHSDAEKHSDHHESGSH